MFRFFVEGGVRRGRWSGCTFHGRTSFHGGVHGGGTRMWKDVRSAPFRCGCRPIPRGHTSLGARTSLPATSGSARHRRFALSRTRGPPLRRVWAVDGSLGGGGCCRPSFGFSADVQPSTPVHLPRLLRFYWCTVFAHSNFGPLPIPCVAGSPLAQNELKEEYVVQRCPRFGVGRVF